MRIAGNSIVRRAWCLLLLVVSGLAGAQSQAVSVTYSPLGGTLSGGAITTAAPSDFTRLINSGATLGDVNIRDSVRPVIGSRDVDMVLQRRMPWAQVAGAASAIGRTIPYVATAVAFIELMDQLRLRSNGSSWNQDPGTSQVPTGQWKGRALSFTSVGTAPTAQQAASLWANEMNGQVSVNPNCGFKTAVYSVYDVLPNMFSVRQTNTPCLQLQSPPFTYYAGPTTIDNRGAVGQPLDQGQVLSCPASTDALNPANSIPAGLPPGYDGKCRTGRYTEPKTENEAAAIATVNASKANAAAVVGSLLGRGVDLAPRVDTPTASGPASVTQPGTTTTTSGPSGTTTGTSTPTSTIIYNGPSYTWNDSTVVTTTNGGGTTTTTTVAPPPAAETCGLPGKPPCKIDETGTPAAIPPYDVGPIEATKGTDATKQGTEIARVVDPGFGWFTVPPMATCAPIAWPGGVQINPCNGIEVVRSIMAYLWALYGAVWSFGVFRRSLPGAA